MKISELIAIFNKCIPVYQKAVAENWGGNMLMTMNMERGLCYFCHESYIARNLNDIFIEGGYYHDFVMPDNAYLFPRATNVCLDEEIEMAILPRLKFLKEQVVALKKLQKKGYTHV